MSNTANPTYLTEFATEIRNVAQEAAQYEADPNMSFALLKCAQQIIGLLMQGRQYGVLREPRWLPFWVELDRAMTYYNNHIEAATTPAMFKLKKTLKLDLETSSVSSKSTSTAGFQLADIIEREAGKCGTRNWSLRIVQLILPTFTGLKDNLWASVICNGVVLVVICWCVSHIQKLL